MPGMSWEQHALRRAGRLALAAAVSLALVTPSASADGMDLWFECRGGNGVSSNHSAADFEDALANPPADAAEYSDCEDQIRAAQAQAQSGGGTPGGGTGTGGTPGSGTPGAPATAVEPQALQQALAAGGVDPAAPPAAQQQAPPPVTVDGKTVDLSEGRLPSLAGALSLPLPLAASGVVVLISAALPVARYLVARFGAPRTGTTPAT